jgi:hypothetical protein
MTPRTRYAKSGDVNVASILATSTVHDLVAGSGIMVEDRGSSALKDVGAWRLDEVLDG